MLDKKLGGLLYTWSLWHKERSSVARSGVSSSIDLARLCWVFGVEVVYSPGIMEGKWRRM
jgi:hypothetical protein